jgi:transposase
LYQALDHDPSRMRTLLLMIAELYGVEDRRLLREQGARPVLEKLHAYLLRIHKELPPRSEAGQAVNYLLKNWTALTRYCDNPALSIDNNHTERSLRGWAAGRNNRTFFGSDRGGRTAAVLRSFVASLRYLKNDHDPVDCFGDFVTTPLQSRFSDAFGVNAELNTL